MDDKATKDLPDERVLRVFYEDLHRDIEQQRKRLYEFLEVDPDQAAELSFNTEPGFEKEIPNRFLRKGAVGDWKNYMTPAAMDSFLKHAGDTMEQLGYET